MFPQREETYIYAYIIYFILENMKMMKTIHLFEILSGSDKTGVLMFLLATPRFLMRIKLLSDIFLRLMN